MYNQTYINDSTVMTFISASIQEGTHSHSKPGRLLFFFFNTDNSA